MDGILSGCADTNIDYCWKENDPYFRAATVGIIDKLNNRKVGSPGRKRKKKEFFLSDLMRLHLIDF